MKPRHWQIDFQADIRLTEPLSDWLSGFAVSVTELVSKTETVIFQAVVTDEPKPAELIPQLAVLAGLAGADIPTYAIREISPDEWTQALRYDYPPITLGKLVICGDAASWAKSARSQRLFIQATTAFGTGEHPTTAGCLRALQRLPTRLKNGPVLDLGCGTGILALAAARLGFARVDAADNDPEALNITRHHNRLNQLPSLRRVILSHGLRNPALRREKYKLIIANIFARPLRQLAPILSQQLMPSGYLILSGIMAHQAAGVMSSYRGRGLMLQVKHSQNNWVVLVYRKP